MKTVASIAGHPIHPILVAFPIASYVGTFTALIFYGATADPFWYRGALLANAVGVATAVLAAIPGGIDYLMMVPRRTVARRTGAVHAILNVVALALFSVSLILLYQSYSAGESPALTAALLLTGAGVALTAVGGFLGYEMVQHHHLGVIDREDGRTVNSPEAVVARWMEAAPVTDSQMIATEDIDVAGVGPIAGPRDDEESETQRWQREGESPRDTRH